jgi:hypothetical protein
MADFRKVLEVSKNSKSFLSYSFSWMKEDLSTEEGMLPNPPMEIDWNDNATIGEVADLIERFSQDEAHCFMALQTLRNTGKVTMVDEY